LPSHFHFTAEHAHTPPHSFPTRRSSDLIASSMQDIVDNQAGYETLPSNIGLTDASIAATTARYNELAMERKRLLESSNEKNPIIVNLDKQLAGLKRSMQASLNTVTNNLALQVNNLSGQLSRINSM